MNQNQFQQQFQQLQLHFRGQLRAQLKPLVLALGIGENTVRNNGNVLTINGRPVRPLVIGNRLTFDLAEVAEALARVDVDAPVQKVQAARGRPRKPGLAAAGAAA